MTKTNLTVVSYRTWDAESLQTDTDSLSSSCSSLLISYLLSDCLVHLLLSLELLSSSFLLCLSIALANSRNLSVLAILPSVETLLSLSILPR